MLTKEKSMSEYTLMLWKQVTQLDLVYDVMELMIICQVNWQDLY